MEEQSYPPDMRVLVIGGTGFIGSHVVRQLAQAGHAVVVLHRGRTEAELPVSVRHLHCVESTEPRQSIPEKALHFAPDAVIHTVAMTQEHARNAVSALRNYAGRLVVLSSGDVYLAYGRFTQLEPGPIEPMPLREDSPLRTVLHPYRAKAESSTEMLYHYEKILVEKEVLGDALLPGTVLRLPKVYGPGSNADFATVHRYRRYPHWRWTHGYVENVAAAIVLAACHPQAAGGIFNVGEAVTPTMGERLACLPPSNLPEDDSGMFDFRQDMVYDTRRIREELGYREIVDFVEGIRRTTDSLRCPG